MKVSYNWLKEFLPALTATPQEVAELLTLHAVETVVEKTIEVDPNIQVVKILHIGKHPNADRLRLATITNGTDEITVVCGAPNIEVGQVVPYSPPGTTVKDADGADFVIAEAKIRGVKSPGMLNSLRELGLHREHGGIWVLPPDTPVGSRLVDHVTSDAVLDLDVTPNRAHDLLSHRGVAREVAALAGIEFVDVEYASLPGVTQEVGALSVSVENTQHAPRYMGFVLEDVANTSSPLWMQARLLASGTKPIGGIVDITNYVMYEIGNPSHAFDRGKITGSVVGVRQAREGERVALLDESLQELDPDIPVITVDDEPVAVAGIMGGIGTEVDDATTNVFLEVANFTPHLIQQASRKLRVRTEASLRFEKEISLAQAEEASVRLLHLFTTMCGARVASGRLDTAPVEQPLRDVTVRPEKITAIVGADVDEGQAIKALEALRFTVEETGTHWNVAVPHDRLDVQIEVDVIEEIVRLIGLRTIPAKPFDVVEPVALPAPTQIRERVRDCLVGLGFTETYNYSFEPGVWAQMIAQQDTQKVEVANPAAPEQKYMRASLLPGLLKNLQTNKDEFHRKFSDQERALFEIGHVFERGEGGRVPGIIEEERIAGVIVGSAPSLQGAMEALTAAVGTLPAPLYAEKISPEVTKKLKYRMPIFAFEFTLPKKLDGADVVEKTEVAEDAVQFRPFSKYPSVYRDISVSVKESVSPQAIEELIRKVGGSEVAAVELFDEFTLAQGDTKALAFHVELSALNRTLTDQEVEEKIEQIVEQLHQEHGAEIR